MPAQVIDLFCGVGGLTRGLLNAGLDVMNGELLAFVDSDDKVERNFIEELYACAEQNGADIAGCDFFIDSGSKSSVKSENPGASPREAAERLLRGESDGYVWIKLIRSNLFKNGKFTDAGRFSMWEDVVLSAELYYYAQKISYIPKPLYHYRFNPESLCNTFSELLPKYIASYESMFVNLLRWFLASSIY